MRPRHVRPDNRPRFGWRDLLDHWPLVMLDLHEVYGADWDDPGLVRSWPWWRDRIWGLLSTRSRLLRAVAPPETSTPRRGSR